MIPELEPRGKEWPSLGPYVCRWIEDNLVFGPGDLLGQPAKLDEEKKFLLWRAYEIYPPGHDQAGRRRFKRVCLSLRKGSAKTELQAWIVAAELAPEAPVRCDGFHKNGTPILRPVRNPYIPLCAYTEEQTEELAYGALRQILIRSKIADQFDVGIERIIRIGKRGMADGKAEAVASSPGARDGARTTFQGFDETSRFITPALRRAHQTMLQNIPKRRGSDAWSLETTTAHQPGQHSVAEATHNYAKMVAEGRLRDSRLFFFHRQASDGYDFADREQRKKAVIEASGPVAEWSSIDEIVDQYDDPTIDRSYWEQVWLNRPVKAADQAFDLERWKALGTRPLYRPPKGARITLGFDGARYHDATAVVGTEIETGFQWLVGLWEKPPNVEKWEVPQGEVEEAVDHAFTFWAVVRMYADPPYWETVVAAWSGKYGEKRVITFLTNRYVKMASTVRAYVNAQLDGHLSHDGNPDFARHIGNAHKRPLHHPDDQGQPLFVISKAAPDSPNKIDAAVAGVLSWEARTDVQKEGKPQKPRISIFGAGTPGNEPIPEEEIEPEEAPWNDLAW
jgi:phage terminase large subunit-like protein